MRIPLAHLLVKSPLPKLHTLMERALDCSVLVPELVGHLIEQDHAAVVRVAKEISTLEKHADEVKNEIRANMPIRLFLPVDRRDVLRMISQIDAIADSAEDVGVLLTLRKMEVPDQMKPLLVVFVERALDAVKTAHELTSNLESLLGAAFSGKAAQQVSGLIDQLARKEHEADKVQDQLAKIVFQLEKELSPVAIYMWMKVFEEIGDMANHAENVGDQFRLFIAR